MSQPGYAKDWQSACIPPTIRRPWNVWENFLEDHVAEASSQAEEVAPDIREQIASVQAKGAKMAFMLLDESVQQQYVEVSYQELAAFANWRRSQVAQQEISDAPPATDFEGCWDLLNHDDKKEWLPQDSKAFLAADLQWAALVTNPLSGPEVKKPSKGEKDKAVKVPLKEEAKKTAVEATKVKEEPGSKADPPKQGAPKAAVVKQEKQSTPAKPVEKPEVPKEKAVMVKKEQKQIVPAEPAQKVQQQAPKDKAKPIQKQEVPKDKAVVVKKEQKQITPAQPPQNVQQQQAPKHKAKPVQNPEAPKNSAVEVKKEPGVSVQVPKPAKTTSSSEMVAVEKTTDKEPPRKEKVVRAKTKEAAPAKPVKAKAKAKATSLQQRLQKKKREVRDDEEDEDDGLMAMVQRSDDEDGGEDADAPAPEVSKPAGKRAKEASRSVPPGRMLVNRQYRAPAKEVPENLHPEALEALCCKCSAGGVCADNDLAMCDRCDKAFHQKCHEPAVTYFGNPEDQWFCLQCTLELAQMRNLQLKVDDFCWVQATGETVAWPAQVLRIDFSSLADPKPYWVQFFDAGPPEGAWVGEIHVKPWSDGPSFGSIVQARRRNAVRLAEAAGATQISTEQRAPASRRKRCAEEDPEKPNPRRRRAVAEDSPEKCPRRSRRGQANVSLLTEPTCPAPKRRSQPEQPHQPEQRVLSPQHPHAEHPECPESPKPKRRQEEDPASTEKHRKVDPQAQSKIDETCDLISQLKEQSQVDQELAQAGA